MRNCDQTDRGGTNVTEGLRLGHEIVVKTLANDLSAFGIPHSISLIQQKPFVPPVGDPIDVPNIRVMILDLRREGMSISEIARRLLLDRKTVCRCIDRGLEPPTYGPRGRREAKVKPLERYRLHNGVSGTPVCKSPYRPRPNSINIRVTRRKVAIKRAWGPGFPSAASRTRGTCLNTRLDPKGKRYLRA